MAEPLDLEEGQRWEAFKAFARRYRSLIGAVAAVVVIGVAAGVGWYQYQSQQLLNASMLYQNGIGALNQDKPEKARRAFANLVQDYPGTVYAAFGRVFQARLLHEQGEARKALAALEPLVKGRQGTAAARQIALEEAGRIHWDRGDVDQALATLDRLDGRAFSPSFYLLKGDLLSVQGRTGDAREAYRTARGMAGSRSLQPGLGARLSALPPETGSGEGESAGGAP